MGQSSYVRRSLIPERPEVVEAWHRRSGALERLVPPWTGTEIRSAPADPRPGDRVELTVRVGPIPLRWVSEIRPLEAGRGFRDVQVRGPFREWIHDHRFRPADDGSVVEDRIAYELPLGPAGRLLGDRRVRERLERELGYRHRTLADDLAAHRRYGPEGEAPLRVAVTGSTGLVGSRLAAFLRTGGHRVCRLVRRETVAPDEVRWIPGEGLARPEELEGIDAVVHLAGENVAGRWTRSKKRRIEESRVESTRKLCADLSRLSSPPDVLVSASASGYYGDRGDEPLTGKEAPGDGFLARVCRRWEAASEPLEDAGTRVVRLRFGMVLTPDDGALAAMLPAFRAGAGGPLGDGLQFMPWIGADDLLDVILHAVTDEELAGAVNAVAPQPVRNREFTETLARILRRPAAVRVPALALRTLGGQMAEEMLLASARMVPAALRDAGHRYRYPELEGALRHLLGRTASRRVRGAADDGSARHGPTDDPASERSQSHGHRHGEEGTG